jgi:hypothetical protein
MSDERRYSPDEFGERTVLEEWRLECLGVEDE